MTRPAQFFLLVLTPALAAWLAVLGFQTALANPVGWFLALTGTTFAVGIVLVYFVRGRRFWESSLSGATTQQERGDRSFWLMSLSLAVAIFLAPIEYLYWPGLLPRAGWLPSLGLALVVAGAVLFVWARRAIRRAWAGHLTVKADQTLVQSGPYRLIRHPGYAGYWLMALGVGLGYASLAGLAACLGLVLPAMMYRIQVEERLLLAHFGDAYRAYARRVRRLIPGVW